MLTLKDFLYSGASIYDGYSAGWSVTGGFTFIRRTMKRGNVISAAVSFIPYNERTSAGGGAPALNADGKLFAVTSAVAPDENGSAMVFPGAVYVLNSEIPLITSATRVEAGVVQKPDLSPGEPEAVPIESLY